MKRLISILALLMTVTFFASNQSFAAGDWNVNTNLTAGAKALNEDDWEPLESQTEIGFNVDFGKKTWPFNIDIGLLASTKKDDFYGADAEGTTTELRAGIRKIWEPTATMRPYISGGLALIGAEIKLSDGDDEVSADDEAVGGYVSGGIYWTMAKHLNLGFEVGYSKATVDLAGYEGDGGGGHALFLVGYHW